MAKLHRVCSYGAAHSTNSLGLAVHSLPWTSLIALFAALGCSSAPADEVVQSDPQAVKVACRAGQLYNPDLGACAAVNVAASTRADSAPKPPKLDELRRAATKQRQASASQGDVSLLSAGSVSKDLSTPSGTAGSLPTPGGLGSGVTYKGGALQALTSATLYTHMLVIPEGFGNLNTWLFNTSTNRTEKGVEVVGIFNSGLESVGVFDWSCSADYPCPGGANSPSWIWTRWVSSNTCEYAMQTDGNGRSHNAMYYANTTQFSGGMWHNQVNFWNYCTNTWDLVYTHDYGGTQQDCSSSAGCNGLGWWGPIMETFWPAGDPNWPLPELGFFGTTLVHDGVTSQLGPSETDFSMPGPVWNLCYRNPNNAWSIGNGNTCPAITESFNSATTQFSAVDGTWAISGGKYALTTANTGATVALNNRSLNSVFVNGDFTLNVVGTATATSDTHDNFAVIFDWADSNNYYFVSLAESNDTTVSGIFKVQNGYTTQIGDITALARPGVRYPVRIERDKEAIRAYLNNVLVGQTNDITFTSGQVGVGTRNNKATFDDFIVTTPRIDERFDSSASRWVVNSGVWGVSGGTYQLTSPSTALVPGLNNSSLHEWPLHDDFTATANVSANATSAPNDNVAFVFDAVDSATYYYVSFGEVSDASTNGVFKVANGTVTKLGALNETFPAATPYTISVSRSGATITVYGKGRLQATVTDASYTTPYGFVGFGSLNTAVTVDNLLVY